MSDYSYWALMLVWPWYIKPAAPAGEMDSQEFLETTKGVNDEQFSTKIAQGVEPAEDPQRQKAPGA